jgi:hypothetical protein
MATLDYYSASARRHKGPQSAGAESVHSNQAIPRQDRCTQISERDREAVGQEVANCIRIGGMCVCTASMSL